MKTQAFQKRSKRANSNIGWVVVRSIVAVVLLIAAGFKVHQLATTPTLSTGIFEARWFQIVLVECELALAVVLLVGIAPKITWVVSTILFLTFTIVSLAKGLNGAESCGCFGAATVNPWITFVMDVGIVAALITFRPTIAVFHWRMFKREFYRAWQSKRVVAVVIVYLLLAVPATYAMMSVESNSLAELGTEFIGADGRKTILLEPEKWVGKKLPILPYLGSDAEKGARELLNRGNWMVLLYHDDCEKCQQVILEYGRLSRELSQGQLEMNFSLVGIPPLAKRERSVLLEGQVIRFVLSDQNNWNAKTPTQITLEAGFVKHVDKMFQ